MAFHLETDEHDLGIHPSFESAIALAKEKVKSSYHYELSEKAVLEAINTFGREYKADWICMLKRKKGLFKRLFEKSITKTEIRLTQTPLLVLPG